MKKKQEEGPERCGIGGKMEPLDQVRRRVRADLGFTKSWGKLSKKRMASQRTRESQVVKEEARRS